MKNLNPHEVAMLSVVEYIALQSAWANSRNEPNAHDIEFARQCEKLSNAELAEKLKELKS